jgi:hypothetical protein
MSKYLPLATVLLCLASLALAVFVFDLAGLPDYLVLEKNAPQPTGADIVARKAQPQKLEEALDRYPDYTEAKQLAKEVIAGRRSLAEAIDEFRKLGLPWVSASYQEQMLKDLRMSEVEWRGRSVISFVRRVLDDRPDEAAAVTDRLKKELQQLLVERKKQNPRPAKPPIKPAR